MGGALPRAGDFFGGAESRAGPGHTAVYGLRSRRFGEAGCRSACASSGRYNPGKKRACNIARDAALRTRSNGGAHERCIVAVGNESTKRTTPRKNTFAKSLLLAWAPAAIGV